MTAPRIVCRFCLLAMVRARAVSGREIAAIPDFHDHADLIAYAESAHHVVVRRKGESADDATARSLREHPEVHACEQCNANGAAAQ